jgi:hypothetical protein
MGSAVPGVAYLFDFFNLEAGIMAIVARENLDSQKKIVKLTSKFHYFLFYFSDNIYLSTTKFQLLVRKCN